MEILSFIKVLLLSFTTLFPVVNPRLCPDLSQPHAKVS